MAKSKVDFQQILLQHGERIGLGMAGGITALLVGLSLFMPGKGFFSGSPSTRAKDLDEVTTRVNAKLSDPNNLPGESDKPPPAGDKLQALNRDVIDSAPYTLASLMGGDDSGSLGRRVPKVFPIEEATAEFRHMRIQSYIFDDRGRIFVLKGDGGNLASGLGGLMGGGGRGGMGAPGGMGMMGGMGGMAGRGTLGLPGQLDPSEGERKNRQVELVPLTELSKAKGTLAEQVRPTRMVLIAAAFPFQKQVEEFRAKLGLHSNGEVLGEAATPDPRDKTAVMAQNAFRFLGVRVQRRELDGDGKPSQAKGPDGKGLGEWHEVDLTGSFKPYVVLTGKRAEPDDPELTGVMWPGLYMTRPMQFRESNIGSGAAGAGGAGMGVPGMTLGGRGSEGASTPGLLPGAGAAPGAAAPGAAPPGRPTGPLREKEKTTDPDDSYPPIERSLELIKKTVNTIKEKNRPIAAAPPDQFRTGDDFDVFSNQTAAAPQGLDGGPGMAMTGRGRAGMAPPGAAPGVRGTPSTLGPGGALPGAAGGLPDASQDVDLPEHVLVRLIDVTVEPGKFYEYRLQVRMGNPNLHRIDVASPAYAREKELVSEWSDQAKPPITVKVPIDSEMHFYAVDQVEYEQRDGNNPRYRDPGPHKNHVLRAGQQIYLQAHRWLEAVTPRGFKSPLLFGEWTMAERFPVWKGEYVGSKERVEVPVWQFARESFSIASDTSTAKRTPGIGVYFGYGRDETDTREAILVDFRTGRAGYERVVSRSEDRPEPPKKVEDTYAVEALVLRPDGKLLVLEGGLDYKDEQRVERVNKVRKRVSETKKPHRPAAGATGIPGGRDR
ncbi:MAG: hypothetical protein U0797_23680 [Gemmataceae bacterium]